MASPKLRRHLKGRRGISIIWVAVSLTAFVGIVSLAVDYGRVQLAKTQLQEATDAAARYASRFVAGGQSAAYQAASLAAGDNSVDGTPLTLQSEDVQVGYWNAANRTFTDNGTPRNAVKISAQRSAARNDAISLWFASGLGRRTCDIHAESIVTGNSQQGMVGLNGITFKNNAFIGSYNSDVTTDPTEGSAGDGASLGTNASISVKNNSTLRGNLILGPSGSSGRLDPTGGTITLLQEIAPPADPAWTPTGNPGGIPSAWTCNSNTTLPSGTYWLTSVEVNANISFAGPATLYVNGDIDVSGSITAYDSIPANLHIYQLGSGRSFSASGSITAVIIAPGSDFSTKNNFNFYGSCLFNTITAKNNADFFYDTSLGAVYGIALVK